MPRNTRAQKRKMALSEEEKVEKVEMKEDGKEKDIPFLEIDEGLINSKGNNTEENNEEERKGKESVEEGNNDKGSSAEEVEGGKVLQNVEEQKKGEENNEKEKESEINNGVTKNNDCIDAQKNEEVGESASNVSEEMQSDNVKAADEMEEGLQCSDTRGVNSNKCALNVNGLPRGSTVQEFKMFANNLLGMDLDVARRKRNRTQIRIDLPDEETRKRVSRTLNGFCYQGEVLRTCDVDSELDKGYWDVSEDEKILRIRPLHDVPYDEQLKVKTDIIEASFRKLSDLVKNSHSALNNWLQTQNGKFNGLPCRLESIVPSPVVEESRSKLKAVAEWYPGTREWIVVTSNKMYSTKHGKGCPLDGLKDVPRISKDAAKLFQTCVNKDLKTTGENITPDIVWKNVCINALEDGRVALRVACSVPNEEKVLEQMKEKMISFFEDGEGRDSVVKTLICNGRISETTTSFTFTIGEKHNYETINGVTFRLAPVLDFPLHRKTLEKLFETVLDLAPKGEDTALIDFSCRSHWIGYLLSKAFGEVHIMGLENTEDARFDAEANDVANCHFYPSDISEQVKIVVEKIKKKNIVVLIYPGDGSERNVMPFIRPLLKVKNIVFILSDTNLATKSFVQSSCMPSLGSVFVPVKAVPVDLSPYRKCCQVVLLMERMDILQLTVPSKPVISTNLQNIAIKSTNPQNKAINSINPQNIAIKSVNPQNKAINSMKPQNIAIKSMNPQNLVLTNVNPQNLVPTNVNPQNIALTNMNPQYKAVTHTNIHNTEVPERVGNWVQPPPQNKSSRVGNWVQPPPQNRSSFSQDQGVQNNRFNTGPVANWKDPSPFEQQDSSPIFSNVFFGEPLIRQIAERVKAGILGQSDRLTFAMEALRKFDAEVARQQQLLGLSNVNMNTPNANLPGCGLKPLPSLMTLTVPMPTPPTLVNEHVALRSQQDSNIPVQFANDARSNVLTERSFEVRADRVTTLQMNDGFMEPWKKRAKVDGGRLRESCDASGVGRSDRTTTPDVPFVANQSAEYQRKFEMLRSAGLSEKEIRFILHRSSMEVVASGESKRRNFQDDRAGCSSRQIGEGLNPSRDQGTRFQQLGNQGELRRHSIDERFTELQFENQLRRNSDFDRVRESEANRAGNAEFDGIRRADLHQRPPNVFRVNRDLPGSFRHFEGDRANRHFDTIRGERNLDGDLDNILDDRDIDVILGDLDIILKDKDVERERDVRTSRGVRDGHDLQRDFERDPDRTRGSNIIDWSRV